MLIFLFVNARIKSGLSFAVALDSAIFNQFFERIFNGCLSNGGNQFHDFTLCELADFFADGSADQFKGRQLFIEQIYTTLKITVCREDDPQQVFYERRGIIASLVPAITAPIQDFVVFRLCLFDLAFQTDIPSYYIAAAVNQ